MQVVHPANWTVFEVVDGLRFRVFAAYNHDIREYELVSKFTITRAVSAMVSDRKPIHLSQVTGHPDKG